MRTKPGVTQVNWWLPDSVLSDLKEYRHEQRLDHLKDAAQKILEEGLRKWKQEREARGGN